MRYILLIIFFLAPTFSHAMLYVQEEKQGGGYILSTTTALIAEGPLSITHITYVSKDDKEVKMWCNSAMPTIEDPHYYSDSLRFVDFELLFYCPYNVYVTLEKNSYIGLTYVSGNYASTTYTPIAQGPTAGTTTVNAVTNGPNFQEWLFVMGVVIFFLAMMTWGRLKVFKFS